MAASGDTSSEFLKEIDELLQDPEATEVSQMASDCSVEEPTSICDERDGDGRGNREMSAHTDDTTR